MAKLLLPLGMEQSFTVANTFSANSTVGGATLVRVVNVGNSTGVITVTNVSSSSVSANLTILPLTETIVQKTANNTLTASSANLLAVAIAFTM